MNETDCLFCKIVAGEIPCYKIYETDKFLAFLDVFPLTPGHTMVIPKKHFRWVWDVEPAGEYFEVISKVANHYRKILNQDLVVSMTVGHEVPHAHYHLIPPGENLEKLFDTIGQVKPSQLLAKEIGKEWQEKLKIK